LLEAQLTRHAAREYIQLLRLLETFPLAEMTALPSSTSSRSTPSVSMPCRT